MRWEEGQHFREIYLSLPRTEIKELLPQTMAKYKKNSVCLFFKDMEVNLRRKTEE